MSKLLSVSSICNFPEKPWLQTWVVKLMKGEYPEWEKGTEPAEVRTEAQQIGTVFHLLAAKKLGYAPSPRLLNAANNAMKNETILAGAYRSFDLWQSWLGTLTDMQPEHVEMDLSDAELGVSGRCDAILLIGGKRIVCDWKTGSELHEGDALEACAYAWLADRKLARRIDGALLVHVPYAEGKQLRVVRLEPRAIVHGTAAFSLLLQAKEGWEQWKILCSTGLKIGV